MDTCFWYDLSRLNSIFGSAPIEEATPESKSIRFPGPGRVEFSNHLRTYRRRNVWKKTVGSYTFNDSFAHWVVFHDKVIKIYRTIDEGNKQITKPRGEHHHPFGKEVIGLHQAPFYIHRLVEYLRGKGKKHYRLIRIMEELPYGIAATAFKDGSLENFTEVYLWSLGFSRYLSKGCLGEDDCEDIAEAKKQSQFEWPPGMGIDLVGICRSCEKFGNTTILSIKGTTFDEAMGEVELALERSSNVKVIETLNYSICITCGGRTIHGNRYCEWKHSSGRKNPCVDRMTKWIGRRKKGLPLDKKKRNDAIENTRQRIYDRLQELLSDPDRRRFAFGILKKEPEFRQIYQAKPLKPGPGRGHKKKLL